MIVYPQVYADLGAVNWIFPRPAFHAYLEAIMRVGLGSRLMFGSDQMYWPEAIGVAVEATDAAPFLSASERRDIFYNNAARFFRFADATGSDTDPCFSTFARGPVGSVDASQDRRTLS